MDFEPKNERRVVMLRKSLRKCISDEERLELEGLEKFAAEWAVGLHPIDDPRLQVLFERVAKLT